MNRLRRSTVAQLCDRWLAEAESLDLAVYSAVARTPTPRLDVTMRRLSRAADYSRLSIAAGATLALIGGPRGRRAATAGLASVAATAAVVNLIVKPLGRRPRPDRADHRVPVGRHVRMPASRSFPSGHTAAAVAFASGVARVLPIAGVPLHGMSALVAYSRVHTGVHYPGDVLAGALLGVVCADITASALARRFPAFVGSSFFAQVVSDRRRQFGCDRDDARKP